MQLILISRSRFSHSTQRRDFARIYTLVSQGDQLIAALSAHLASHEPCKYCPVSALATGRDYGHAENAHQLCACANHQGRARRSATHRDAAEIGTAWAMFVRRQLDVRRPWPPFSGRAAAIALRLVQGLAAEPRRSELAGIGLT